MNHSRRGGSCALSNRVCRATTPRGGSTDSGNRPACKASITSRQTGAAPLTPETCCIASPLELPTHTPTV